MPLSDSLEGLWISLHKYSLKRPRISEFIGLGNFQQLLASDEFWSALWVTSQEDECDEGRGVQ